MSSCVCIIVLRTLSSAWLIWLSPQPASTLQLSSVHGALVIDPCPEAVLSGGRWLPVGVRVAVIGEVSV